jgi:hypothetical protein
VVEALAQLEHERTTVAANKLYAGREADLGELERRLHRSVAIPHDEQLAAMLDAGTYQLEALARTTRMGSSGSDSRSPNSSSDAPALELSRLVGRLRSLLPATTVREGCAGLRAGRGETAARRVPSRTRRRRRGDRTAQLSPRRWPNLGDRSGHQGQRLKSEGGQSSGRIEPAMRKRGLRSTFRHAGRESAPKSGPATITNSITPTRMIAKVPSSM